MAFDELKPGEGAVIEVNGQPVAGFRDSSGTLHTFSALCTHEECTVEWNGEDHSWDCPCHGSRFTGDGHVINGPAIEPLKPVKV